MKKLHIIASAVVFAALATTSCTSKEQEPNTTTPVQTSTTTETTTTETTTPETSAEIAKPSKIVYMGTTTNTTPGGAAGGLEAWVAEYTKLTGIELEFQKPDHNKYQDNLSLSFTSGSAPDAAEMGASYYPAYAHNGALWDMTSAWENSDLKATNTINEKYVDGVKIDGVLYGFPMSAGGGTVTYVRQDWLDNLGMDHPTNYDEFYAMLEAFTFNDPNKSGSNDTYGLTAAGFIGTEAPFSIYMREFYQSANPDIIMKDGKYVDGMLEPEMVDALQRMQDAYKAGVLDLEIATNKTSACRDKFYASNVGVFNYWAGTWNENLQNNLALANPEGVVVPLAPIDGVDYIERPATVMAITNQSKNPEGVFEHFVLYSHDSGEGQMLFTYGVENLYWEKDASGKPVMLPNPENNKMFVKSYFSPELSINNWDSGVELPELTVSSLELFNANSVQAGVPLVTDVITTNYPEVQTLKQQLISEISMGKKSVEDGLAEYAASSKAYMDPILADLNK